jgi:RNA polymerase sigma-70 factor (ECF subfamily)
MNALGASVSDEELMQLLCSATDRGIAESAFGEVFARYHGRVVSWCYRIAKNRDRSNDLAQEVFLKAYRHRHSFRGEARLSTWLYAIARNHCLTSLRHPEPDVLPYDAVKPMSLRDTALRAPDAAAELRELATGLAGMMTRFLEPLEARVMTLHYAHEIPLAAITRELGLQNPSGAKAYIVNARRKLSGGSVRRGQRSAKFLSAYAAA